ncbi:hypothetical protein HDU83_003071 [Entophlyctis luteolus]|nr:hypothetical protein HDU83_003071 [Entophlyctis luteolus]KAJ3385374.1 hypothetical protein HDU84_002271 [Entophlyctis sp. JEL0112]
MLGTPRAIRASARTYSSAASPSRGSSVRGTLFGFACGAGLVGFAAYTNLVSEYREASSSLLGSVDTLKSAVSKLENRAKRLDALEAEVASLTAKVASKTDLERTHNALLKVTDDITVAHLELKSDVWELRQDLNRK